MSSSSSSSSSCFHHSHGRSTSEFQRTPSLSSSSHCSVASVSLSRRDSDKAKGDERHTQQMGNGRGVASMKRGRPPPAHNTQHKSRSVARCAWQINRAGVHLHTHMLYREQHLNSCSHWTSLKDSMTEITCKKFYICACYVLLRRTPSRHHNHGLSKDRGNKEENTHTQPRPNQHPHPPTYPPTHLSTPTLTPTPTPTPTPTLPQSTFIVFGRCSPCRR